MKVSNYQQFKPLHYSSDALLLPNVWDAGSALVFQGKGFRAVGTSSAAVANSLGYQDGEEMPFEDLLFIVSKICERTDLLLSVDIEGGYSRDVQTICENIEKLAKLGVVGINIEDSAVADDRQLVKADSFAETIKTIKDFCSQKGLEIFVNVRTDTYLLGVPNKFDETLERINLFEKAGADGIFIPCLTDLAEMKSLCSETNLPVNVMCMPDLADFGKLSEAGIKRISMGNSLQQYLATRQVKAIDKIVEEQNFSVLF